MIYDPAEDSELLKTQVLIHAKGKVLDMGTGSGIQALTAISNASVRKVLAVDINTKCIAYCKNKHKLSKITWKTSNLFANVAKTRFDTIIFNPPYLPKDQGAIDEALLGNTR